LAAHGPRYRPPSGALAFNRVASVSLLSAAPATGRVPGCQRPSSYLRLTCGRS
jgi:hypothetical protein